MALKRKITKAEHAALNALIQAEYKADGEDFVLDAEGFDDPAELRRAKDREVAEAARLRTELAGVKTQLDTITQADARRAGDVATLDTSWKAKNEALRLEYEGKLTDKDKFIKSTLVDAVANAMAADLGGESAAVLLPHISARLSADMTGEKPLTRVLDKDGKLTAMSVEDLKKEFAGDARFKAVIIQSKASGGGAAGGNRNTSGAGGSGEKKFKDLNDTERTEWFKRDPTGFKQAAEDARRAM